MNSTSRRTARSSRWHPLAHRAIQAPLAFRPGTRDLNTDLEAGLARFPAPPRRSRRPVGDLEPPARRACAPCRGVRETDQWFAGTAGHADDVAPQPSPCSYRSPGPVRRREDALGSLVSLPIRTPTSRGALARAARWMTPARDVALPRRNSRSSSRSPRRATA